MDLMTFKKTGNCRQLPVIGLFWTVMLIALALASALQLVGCREQTSDGQGGGAADVEDSASLNVTGQDSPRALVVKYQEALKDGDRKAFVECWSGNNEEVRTAMPFLKDRKPHLFT